MTRLPPLNALIVGDDPDYADALACQLVEGGFEIDWQRVETETDFFAALQTPLDIILAQFLLPQLGGMRVLELLQATDLDIPIILIAGHAGEEVALQAMRYGATDFFYKHDTARLPTAVRRALDEKQMRAERRKTLEALRNSDQRLRSIISNTMDCIFELTSGGQVSEINDAGLAMLQADNKGALQREDFLSFIRPEYRQKFKDLHRGVFQGKGVLMEFEVDGLQGRRRWVETHASPLRNVNDQVESAICISRDVTERKQSEELLRAQVEELQRWQAVTLGREERVLALKAEVNEVLKSAGRSARYAGQ